MKPGVLAAVLFIFALPPAGTAGDLRTGDGGRRANAPGRPISVLRSPTLGKGPAVARRPLNVSAKPIAALVRELGNERYRVRHRATVELSKRGAKAIPAVTAAADTRDPETAARAVDVLELIYTNPRFDETTLTQAESALESLRKSKRATVAQLADQVFSQHDDIREKRAIAAIERLGGIVKYEVDRYNASPVSSDGPVLNCVVLGSKWKGGDAGLKYIARLSNLPALYIARNRKFTPISLKAQNKLQQMIPTLKIEERGLACLGVRGQKGAFNSIGCYVAGVEADSAAARGGMRTGDIISEFAGKRIRDFDQLVEQIGNHGPGETVDVQILRNGRPQSLKVKLGEWKK